MKQLTANQITQDALMILQGRGADVWRNNQLRVPGRPFRGRKGVADIIGFMRTTGLMVMCEVKALGDELSDDQITMLANLSKAGGFALIATEIAGRTTLNEFLPF